MENKKPNAISWEDVEIIRKGALCVRVRRQCDFKPSRVMSGAYAVDASVVDGHVSVFDARGFTHNEARKVAIDLLMLHSRAANAA